MPLFYLYLAALAGTSTGASFLIADSYILIGNTILTNQHIRAGIAILTHVKGNFIMERDL